MSKKILFRRMRRNPFFVIGTIAAVFILLMALLAPVLTSYDPVANSLSERFLAPEYFSNGWNGHILGTDNLGRDIFSRLLYGARTTFVIAFGATIISIVLGTILGVLAGYFGGLVDAIVMRACDVLQSTPTVIIGIIILSLFGSGTIKFMLVLGLCLWVRVCKITRNSVYVQKDMDYAKASKVLGAKSGAIMFRQIFPNVTTGIIIQASQQIGVMILMQAVFAFLGLGVLPPAPSWGHMISAGRDYLTVYPWMAIVPGVALMITAIAFNFLGDGVRDVLDPKRTVV